MVKLSIADFAEATNRMIQLSGLKRTRVTMKLRPSDKRIVLKSTDQKSTLTTTAYEQKDLKLVEQIISDYITRCTRSAPAAEVVEASSANADKKAAKKAKAKAAGGK